MSDRARPLKLTIGAVLANTFIACCYTLGGRIGWLMISVYSYIIIRQIFWLALTKMPFRLDRNPLPPLLYFAPCPSPSNFWGILQLYVLPIIVGLCGWHFGGPDVTHTVKYLPLFSIPSIVFSVLIALLLIVILTLENLYIAHMSSGDKVSFFSYLNAASGIAAYYLKLAAIFYALIVWGKVT